MINQPSFKSLSTLVPPRPKAEPLTTSWHGYELVDEYAWIKADNWKEVLKDPSHLPETIRNLLNEENAYCEAVMAATNSLQTTLRQEMRARVKEDDSSIPARDGPFVYYTRFREGGEQGLACRRPYTSRDNAAHEQMMLDGDALAQPHDYFDIGDAAHSPDHTMLAWSVDDQGSEYYTIRVRDLATGEDHAPVLVETNGDIVWQRDSQAFYYVVIDENHRPWAVRRHVIGTMPEDDETVFTSDNPGHFLDLDETQSGAYAIISIADHETSECYLLDLNHENAQPTLVAARRPHIRYEVDHHGDHLYILTNADDAIDSKIVMAPLATPSAEHWRDIVPHKPGTLLLEHVLFSESMVRLERENALPRIVIRHLESGEEHSIAFEEEAYSLGLSSGYEFETDTFRFTYSSMTTPRETYDYSMSTRQRILLKRQEVPSGHDPRDYVTRRIEAVSHDGARVPVSLLYRKDTPLDGSAPCFLYGYGAYGYSTPASFETNRLSLVNRGFIFAIAHVRGGTEKGWQWYLDGKKDKKTNTFKDFIAVADFLISQGLTRSKQIVAYGGSAGGMLMGAVVNMAPHLFAGVIADVPFVDCLNTILDDQLPLTPPEWPEWGDPITDKAAFETIRSYSPYDNVTAQDYPAILAVGGLSDPRVTYWEPAKWVSRLRARTTGDAPVLLTTNMSAGHGGASGRFEYLREVALVYAFALMAVGKLLATGKTDAA